jgi:DNA polymerase-3 subunit alpha
VKGSWERGLKEATAREIFDLITFFGGYGFNKSHTAAYAQIGYQTAYLKTHYTPEFMAALLSSEIEDGNKRDIMVEHIADARRLGVEVRPPHINEDDVEFTVSGKAILFGLTAIKGVGRGAAAEIVRAREEKGPFRDLYEFCERIDLKIVNRAAIEKLIKGGAFDCFHGARRPLWEALGPALSAAAETQQDRRRGQRSFFDVVESNGVESPAPPLPPVGEWPSGEKLKYEKEALDFYFSSHPLAEHDHDLRCFTTHSLNQLEGLPANQEVVVGGMVNQLRFRTSEKSRSSNNRYALFQLEDLTGTVECVLWADDLARQKEEIRDGLICVLKTSIDLRRERLNLIVSRVFSLEQAKREFARSLSLSLRVGDHDGQTVDQVVHILRQARGDCPVMFYVFDGVGKRADLRVGTHYYVNPTRVSVAELEALLGVGKARFVGPNPGRTGTGR